MEKELSRMAALCSRREYSEQDIKEKLERREVSQKEIDKILQALREGGYLNESRYAKAFARDKSSLSGWGASKISFALRRKGLSQEDISEALLQIDNDKAEEKMKQIILNKWKQLSSEKDTSKRIQKCVRFSLGRGYSYDQIKQIINKDLE